MKPKDLILRLKRYPIAVLSFIVVVACLAVFFLRGSVLEELTTKESELNSRLRLIDKNEQNAKDIVSDVERVNEQVEAIDEKLFDRDERAINTNFFYAFEDRVDVLISNVNQLVLEDPALGPKGPNALNLHSVIVFDIEAKGSFQDILKLLYELHTADAFIRVSDLQITKGGNYAPGGDLNARMRVLVLAEKTEAKKS